MNFVFVLTLSLGGPAPAQPARDPWFGRDKTLHFVASALVQGSAHAAFRAAGASYARASWSAAGVTAAVGVGKELWDRRRGRDVSLRDLAWDGLGGGAGAIIVRQVDRH